MIPEDYNSKPDASSFGIGTEMKFNGL